MLGISAICELACGMARVVSRGLTAGYVFLFRLLAGHEARYAAKHGGCPQRRRDVVPVAVNLDHKDPNLERAVDLTLLHKIPPHNTILRRLLTPMHPRNRRRPHSHPRRTTPQMRPRRSSQTRAPLPRRNRVALLHKLTQVKPHDAKRHALVAHPATGDRELLEDLELDVALRQGGVAVNGDADGGDDL